MADLSYQPKVYFKPGRDEMIVADGGQVTVESGGKVSVGSGGSIELTSEAGLLSSIVRTLRARVTTAEVNAGKTLLAALTGYKYRLVDCLAIAIGGNAETVTTVDILGTQSAAGAKLVAFAQASLQENVVLRAGGTGAAVLNGGASFVACDAGAAITIGKTGSNLATATHIDVVLSYVIEA